MSESDTSARRARAVAMTPRGPRRPPAPRGAWLRWAFWGGCAALGVAYAWGFAGTGQYQLKDVIEGLVLGATLSACVAAVLGLPMALVSYLAFRKPEARFSLTPGGEVVYERGRTRGRRVRADEVAGAWLVGLSGERWGLEVQTTAGERLVGEVDHLEARSALAALGHEGPAAVSVYRTGEMLTWPFTVAFFAMAVVLVPSVIVGAMLSMSLFLGLIPVFALAVGYASRPKRLAAGDDGVGYDTFTGSRFLPWHRIASVELRTTTVTGRSTHTSRHLELLLESGGKQSLSLDGLSAEQAALLTSLLSDAARERRAREAGAPAALLAIEGQDVATWKQRVRLVGGSDGYRQQSLSPAELREALADQQASPDRRLGAALALRAAGVSRDELRVVVNGESDDELRKALEAAVDDELDDHAVEQLLRR